MTRTVDTLSPAHISTLRDLGITVHGGCAGRVVLSDSHCRWITGVGDAITALILDDESADLRERFQAFCDHTDVIYESAMTRPQLAALRRYAGMDEDDGPITNL